MEYQSLTRKPGWLGSRVFPCAVILSGILIGAAPGQQSSSTGDPAGVARSQADVAQAIQKAAQDTPESLSYVERLAQARAVQAVPALEAKFARTHDETDRAHIASALVRLGDKDDKYWQFLVQEARPAIESDAPTVIRSDSQRGPSPEFVAWAGSHDLDADSALRTMFKDCMRFLFLAQTGDPRGIPLLRRALFAPYVFTQAFAAEGLAADHDNDSIPLIVQAVERSNRNSQQSIATPLVYFNDPRAQIAVDTYVPKDLATSLREAVANGKRPFQ